MPRRRHAAAQRSCGSRHAAPSRGSLSTAWVGAGAGATTVGTVQYLSPEQARGGAADMRSDIYSLGVTLFHLVVGRLPFESSDDEEV